MILLTRTKQDIYPSPFVDFLDRNVVVFINSEELVAFIIEFLVITIICGNKNELKKIDTSMHVTRIEM